VDVGVWLLNEHHYQLVEVVVVMMMERALLRLLRSHALRASRVSSSSSLLQRGVAVRRSSQQLRAFLSASSLDTVSQFELRDFAASRQRPIWEPWSRGFADVAGGPGEVVIPFMGDSVPDGVIAAILKKPGDAVAVDEIIAQIETDKVTIDVRSPVAGKIESVQMSCLLGTICQRMSYILFQGLVSI
jgi:2-oxoglutarate dehydrogenase E2 component (dihydrolipoamide succinyltransferase)